MKRLIDANALKKSFDEHVYLVHHGFNETEYGCTQYGIHQIIDEQPTIDAVPVIRCKDCRWWWEGMRVCALKEHLVDGVCAVLCMEDDFCSRAEPKEADG